MTDILSLDEGYSTTRLIFNDKCLMLNEDNSQFNIENSTSKKGGLRTKGYFKKSFDDKPLISIITVVFNGEKYLEETIQSVINQTYSNVEYIIIDGGSSDGTLDIIKKYEERIDYWVSEKDNGIYDAMNKGIDVASGEWLNFMNAGDGFYDAKTIQNIFSIEIKYSISLLYGNTDIGYKILKYKPNLNYKDMAQGMMICHQSAFYRNKGIKYNLTYKLCGDQDFTIQYLHQQKDKSLYINKPIAKYDLDGI